MAGKIICIGKDVRIVQAKNKSYEQVAGTIVDETKQSFVIRCPNKDVRVLKAGTIFNIAGNVVDGNTLTKRVEDRIKK